MGSSRDLDSRGAGGPGRPPRRLRRSPTPELAGGARIARSGRSRRSVCLAASASGEQEAMSPLNLVLRSAASGLRQTGRAMQFVADRLGELGGDAHAQSEDEPAPAQDPGAVERARPRSTAQPKPLDDVSITRKVETELFRDPDVPKGQIDVNTAGGVVWLRGEAETPKMINDLERRARDIPEVQGVENLLHLPKTPAPSRADTPRRQQKTRRSKPRQTQRRTTARKTVEPGASASAEPTPREVAGKGEGRPPAPLGSEEAGDE